MVPSCISYINVLYRVILSVLDPRKWEYLKDDSLDFEHAYMTTYLASWEACRYLFAALWHPDVIGTTTGVWRHVVHSRVIVLCGSETSSETANFSRMEPHATPRITAWPNRNLYWWPDYFESLMAAKISSLKSARFFPVGRLKRKSLCQQATHHTGTGKQHSAWNCCD